LDLWIERNDASGEGSELIEKPLRLSPIRFDGVAVELMFLQVWDEVKEGK
jgi:hypothetical protein